jgi:hypothetical protein
MGVALRPPSSASQTQGQQRNPTPTMVGGSARPGSRTSARPAAAGTVPGETERSARSQQYEDDFPPTAVAAEPADVPLGETMSPVPAE